jgi:hypothetical protein
MSRSLWPHAAQSQLVPGYKHLIFDILLCSSLSTIVQVFNFVFTTQSSHFIIIRFVGGEVETFPYVRP